MHLRSRTQHLRQQAPIQIPISQSNDLTINQCPVCHKIFQTPQGIHSHLQSALLCRQWGKGKRREILDELLNIDDGVLETGYQSLDDDHEADRSSPGPPDMTFDADTNTGFGMFEDEEGWDEEEDFFHFVDVEEEEMVDVGIGEDGPGPGTTGNRRKAMGRVLDEDDDTRVKVEYTANGAGKCIRMDKTIHDRWKRRFGDHTSSTETSSMQDNPYAPFASELDWRIAHWAVKDGIGHKSFDRFLSIPGVRVFILFNIYATLNQVL